MKISNIVVVVSFIWLVISFWNRNDLPGDIAFVPQLDEEPRQTRTRKKPFEANYKGITYEVKPEYEYDLHGLVVSFRHHDGKSRMHFRANDHLNMLDVCVVWGDSAKGRRLNNISFWNGIFTCMIKTRDRVAWAAFDMTEISNNHLISDDDYIRDRVRDIRVGDQIRVKGYLASYSGPGGGERGTSTVRDDTGDGACETIYVEDFDIVRAGTSYWRMSMWASLAVLILGLIAYFRKPYKPYKA